MIQLLGLTFAIETADVVEESVTDPDPARNVVETARLKAAAVAQTLAAPAIVIGADTTVACDGEMLNKPADAAEAKAMLRRLRNRTHQVHTGLALLATATGRWVTDVATIDVPMRPYTDAEIDAYVATRDPLDKAGAYAIQHLGFRPVSVLQGCYAGVVGLPLCHLTRSLRRLGVVLTKDVAAACQIYTQYDCPIYQGVLEGK
jgi:MAF protein